METHVNTPQVIFNLPQRLLVPLFQRPYVWDEERQWQPLWQDVERIADKVLAQDHTAKHFLGAVVLQQEAHSIGTLIVRTVIDGQQRLTTLQLLFDAIHEEIGKLGFEDIARRLVDLVENSAHQRRSPEDQFKVWPTNRDRDAFAEVMSTPHPNYAILEHKGSKIVKAHAYFAHQAHMWLTADSEGAIQRASALVDAVATRLQIVSIDLKADEDAQEIFETLNARGTPLSAADLIKNLVFQRLDATPEEAEKAYHAYWEQFETEFWETEISSGRVLWSRSSLFLTQWLTSQTQQDIPAREVFTSFKRHLDDRVSDVIDLLTHLRACADIYQGHIEAAAKKHEPLDPVQMFVYRIGEMQSEIMRPVLIWLTDPQLPQIPRDELQMTISALESWLVRRTLVREKSAGQNRFVIDLLGQMAHGSREDVGTRTVNFLADQTADTAYWPDDETVRNSLADMQIYRRISRGRLRMILEAIEDHKRGFGPGHRTAKGEQPVVRTQCTIEHVMPQRWGQHWPLGPDEAASERDATVQTLGNLTLVSESLNPSLSNAAWDGDKGKRKALNRYSSIKLTSDIITRADNSGEGWTEDLIQERTESLVDDILAIWPVPRGHTNEGRRGGSDPSGITVKDLIASGLLQPGQKLVGAAPKFRHFTATVLADGRIDVDGSPYDTPSGAGKATAKRNVNGWSYWRLDKDGGQKLIELRRQLIPSETDISVGPFPRESLNRWWTKDTTGLEQLALAITDALPARPGEFRSMFGKGHFRVGRYWAYDEDAPNVLIGVPKTPRQEDEGSPIWARYGRGTNQFAAASERLQQGVDSCSVDADSGALWIPLSIQSSLQDADLVHDMVEQVLRLDRVARGASE